MRKRFVAGLLAIAVFPLATGVSAGTPSAPSYRYMQLSTPHVQTVAGWMLENSLSKLLGGGGHLADRDEAVSYFSLAGRYRKISDASWELVPAGPAKMASLGSDLPALRAELDALGPGVERLIQAQVGDALKQGGVAVRLAGLEVLFPPVLFRFEAPPNLLVISPRTRIERTSTVLLHPRLTVEEAERLEITISRGDVSALVTPIGGLGVYPSMVPENTDIRWTLRTVAHEWAHQFLALRPLGWRYAFGSEKDGRMVTVNETVAEVAGREVGDTVYRQSYRGTRIEGERSSSSDGILRSTLREVRVQVDRLLALGKVDEAESFMEASREGLAKKGYFLRKLNQAYFAFHGSYADEPYLGGPQGEDVAGRVHALREKSTTLGEFLWRVSSADSYPLFQKLAPLP